MREVHQDEPSADVIATFEAGQAAATYSDVDQVMAEGIARRVCPSAPLDLGIAYATWLLISQGAGAGIKTCESCDGSPGHSYADPTVVFYGSPGAAWHAVGIVLDHGLPVLDLAQVWQLGPVGPDAPPVWHLRFRREVCAGLSTPPLEEYYAAAVRGDQ